MNVFKNQARRLRDRLATLGVQLTHSHSLEGIAAVHGARDWNTLSATGTDALEKSGRDPEVLDAAYALLELESDEEKATVVAASRRDDGVLYAAVTGTKGEVHCLVFPNPRTGKEYYEGDAYACMPSRAVLESLSESDHEGVITWRRSAWVAVHRQEAIDKATDSRCIPWCLYYSSKPLECALKDAHYCIAVDDTGLNFEATNGREKARFSVATIGDTAMFAVVPLNHEGWNDEPGNEMRRGFKPRALSTAGIALGPSQHQVAVEIAPHGGLVRWSALPFHYADEIDMSEQWNRNLAPQPGDPAAVSTSSP